MDQSLDEMRHARLHRDINNLNLLFVLFILGFTAIIAFANLTSDEGKLAVAVTAGIAYSFVVFQMYGTLDEVKATIKDNEKSSSYLQQYYNKLQFSVYKGLIAIGLLVPAALQIFWIYS